MEPLFPVVILAGGLATRLRPITETIPKSLINIHNKPFIDHQLRLLASKGIKQVILCIGYLGEMIKQHVGCGRQYGLDVIYSFDGPRLLGTGGAIKQAASLLSDNFFVLYGDSYLDCPYATIQSAFKASQKLGLMTVFHNASQWDTSNIEYANGKIIAYDKKNLTPAMKYIDYGLGILSHQALTHLPDYETYDLSWLYQTLLNTNQLAAYEVKNRFYEVGSIAGMKELEYYLSHQKEVLDLIE